MPRLAVRMTNEVTDRLGCDDEPSAASQAVPRDRAASGRARTTNAPLTGRYWKGPEALLPGPPYGAVSFEEEAAEVAQ